MMRSLKRRFPYRFFLVSLAALLLGACAETEPSQFYVLSAIDAPRAAGRDAAHGVRLAVGPVKLPKHLNRAQIVVHRSTNRIDLLEFERWGEALDDNITRVLEQNLSALVPTDRIVGYPWDRNIPVDYQITLDFARLSVEADRRMILEVRWRIFDYAENRLVREGKSVIGKPAPGTGSDGVAAAISAGLADLGREIATAARSLPYRK